MISVRQASGQARAARGAGFEKLHHWRGQVSGRACHTPSYVGCGTPPHHCCTLHAHAHSTPIIDLSKNAILLPVMSWLRWAVLEGYLLRQGQGKVGLHFFHLTHLLPLASLPFLYLPLLLLTINHHILSSHLELPFIGPSFHYPSTNEKQNRPTNHVRNTQTPGRLDALQAAAARRREARSPSRAGAADAHARFQGGRGRLCAE